YEVIGEAKWQTLDSNGTENEVYVYGYQYSKFRAVLFHTLCILSCGIPYFAMAYYPMLHRCKYINVPLRHATAVGITDKKRRFKIQHVREMELNLSSHRESRLRYFMHQHNRHIWHAEQGVFIHVITLNDKITIAVLMENLIKLYGPNSVVVAVKSYWKLFVEEVFNPFYLFQVFSIILWSMDEYYPYATCVLILSALSCGVSLHQTKQAIEQKNP
ncbi:putative ATPase type 13A3, partial [Operophtera brumata]